MNSKRRINWKEQNYGGFCSFFHFLHDLV